jgi:hypothetical protein
MPKNAFAQHIAHGSEKLIKATVSLFQSLDQIEFDIFSER